ncbi:MAG: S9 family peptidase [Gemmatimonadaceae bacterium]
MNPSSRSARVAFGVVFLVSMNVHAQSAGPVAKRPLRSSDVFALRTVSDPQLSPEGTWIAYTVSSVDSVKDKSDSDIWMTNWEGTQNIRLTSTPEGESSPRWSPDGRYLAFLSSRQDAKDGQIWLLDRRGGEAQQLTKVKGGISGYAWSPDSKRLAVQLDVQTDSIARKDSAEHKTPKPIVIDRYNFKQDITGFLGTTRTQLGLFDIATKQLDTLTRGLTDDGSPSWSPDGQKIAFVREWPAEPGIARGSDVFVIEAKKGATEKQLTTFDGDDGGTPSWSPDGRWVAFLRGDEPKLSAYNLNRLAVVLADGSAPARVVTANFDRPIASPKFTANGLAVLATVADDRAQPLVRVRVADGKVEYLVQGNAVIAAVATSKMDRTAILMTSPNQPPEIFAVDGLLPASNASVAVLNTRQLSHQNDSLFAQIQLGSVEGLTSKSKDGTEVHSMLFKPFGAVAGARLPTIMYIHGGPNGQDSYGFDFDRQLFAANGYAVIGVNYRGSSGRGSAYQKAIFADWGNKEVDDILGAVDEAIRLGVADGERLGIGGWSYGGILTDYTIATTTRFKAAISGAGSALQLSMYGTDQYITQYEMEIGQPWKAQDAWIKLSYPFFHADRIKTPTLFMGGQSDFNVPVTGGEQMYQALRSLGVETQLVIYPSQFHGLTVPSYKKDRLDRYLGWYNAHLKTKTF